MALRINFNAEATVTHTALLRNERAMNKSLLRISTGQRILSAADDAAGLFIADQLSVVAAALEQGNRNIQTGISALQIAETNVGQIFEKLQQIYTKAQSAANDINDPNARAALQRDVNSLVNAIQKIGTDTEYNGIKLLDGTFSDKVIHYGARVNQVITVGISDVRATALGAFMVEGQGKSTVSTSQAYTDIVTGNWAYGAGDSVIVNGINLASGLTAGAVDAYSIARAINTNSDLQLNGISARAKNSVTGASWGGVSVVVSGTASAAGSATIQITEGANTDLSNANKTITLTQSTTSAGTLFANLDSLVSDINSQAVTKGLSIRAYNENGSLVLKSEEGKTIGVQVRTSASSADAGTSVTVSFDLNQIFGGASAVVSSTGAGAADSDTGSGIKVGDLTIAGIDAYKYDFTGISTATQGLGVAATGDATAYDLTTLNVTTNEKAELALDIVNKALQKVDKIRTQIGSVINNLQAIWDGQKASFDNTKEAENVIRNTDFAAEMSNFVTMQIRMQSGVAMLAQANALPQLVLQLLR